MFPCFHFSIKRIALHRKYLSFIHTYAQGAWVIHLPPSKEMRIVCQNVHGSHFCGQQGDWAHTKNALPYKRQDGM